MAERVGLFSDPGALGDFSGIDLTTANINITVDGVPVGGTMASLTEEGFSFVPTAPPDGTYLVTVDISDIAGNPAIQTSWTFTLDRSIPEITSRSPAVDAWTNNATPLIQIGYSDFPGIDTVNGLIFKLGGDIKTPQVIDPLFLQYTPELALLEGPHTVSLELTDTAGNSMPESDTWTFYVDTIAPAVAADSPAQSSVINTTPTEISGLFNDPGALGDFSGIDLATANINITVDGSPVGGTMASLTEEEFSFVPTAPLDGTYTVTVDISDIAENPAPTASWSFVLDRGLPILANPLPVIGSGYPNTTLISADFEDLVSGIDLENVAFILNLNGNSIKDSAVVSTTGFTYDPAAPGNLLLTPGENTVDVTLVDMAANSQSFQWVFYVDTAAPEIEIVYPLNGSLISNLRPTLEANFNDLDGNGAIVLNENVQVYLNGEQPGDLVAHSPKFEDPQNPLNVTGFTYAIPDDLSNGDHQVKVQILDEANNARQIMLSEWTFTVDEQGPSITVYSPTEGDFLNDPLTPIRVDFFDNTPTTISEETITFLIKNEPVPFDLVLDNGHPIAAIHTPATGAPLAEGESVISFTVADMAGQSASVSWSIFVDLTPPTFFNYDPIGFEYSNDPTHVFSATVYEAPEGSGVDWPNAEVDFIDPSGTAHDVKSLCDYTGGVFTFDPALLDAGTFPNGMPDGANVLTVTIPDSAGNSDSLSLTLQVDTVAPPAPVIIPGNIYIQGDVITVVGELPDPAIDIIASMNITGTGAGEVQYEFFGDTFVATFLNAVPGTETPLVYDFTFIDLAGNESTLANPNLNLTFDPNNNNPNPPPTGTTPVTILGAEVEVSSGQSQLLDGVFYFEANDAHFNFHVSGGEAPYQVELQIEAAPTAPQTMNSPGLFNFPTVTSIPEGRQSVVVTVTDANGQLASEYLEIVADRSAPHLDITSVLKTWPIEHLLTNNGSKTYPITGSATDDLSFVNDVVVTIESIGVISGPTSFPNNDNEPELEFSTTAGSNGTEGTYIATVTATDLLGHEVQKQITFELDTTPPNPTFPEPYYPNCLAPQGSGIPNSYFSNIRVPNRYGFCRRAADGENRIGLSAGRHSAAYEGPVGTR